MKWLKSQTQFQLTKATSQRNSLEKFLLKFWTNFTTQKMSLFHDFTRKSSKYFSKSRKTCSTDAWFVTSFTQMCNPITLFAKTKIALHLLDRMGKLVSSIFLIQNGIWMNLSCFYENTNLFGKRFIGKCGLWLSFFDVKNVEFTLKDMTLTHVGTIQSRQIFIMMQT